VRSFSVTLFQEHWSVTVKQVQQAVQTGRQETSQHVAVAVPACPQLSRSYPVGWPCHKCGVLCANWSVLAGVLVRDARQRETTEFSRLQAYSRQMSSDNATSITWRKCASGFFPLSTLLGFFLPVALLFACSLFVVVCALLIQDKSSTELSGYQAR
jgi:hypothetical protein